MVHFEKLSFCRGGNLKYVMKIKMLAGGDIH